MATYTAVKKGNYDEGLADLLFGSRGECKLEDLESDKDFCVGIFKDGIWESRRNDIGTFSYLKQECDIPYLETKGEHIFEMSLPSVPYGMALGIVEFFKKIMQIHSGAEAMVQIWWNKSEEKYQLYVPIQRVSGASVKFDHSEELQNDPNLIWAVDIHSHNSMSAFFSAGDNADEKSTRMFGVIGQLNRDRWMAKWRAGCNGQYVNLEVTDIFNMEDLRMVHIPDAECEKVEKLTYAPYKAPAANRHGGGYHGYDYGRSGGRNTTPPINGWGDDDIYSYYDKQMGVHGGFDTPGMSSAYDLTEDPELEGIVEDFIEINEKEGEGELDQIDLHLLIRRVVDYFAEYKGFDKNSAQVIIDQLSVNMSMVDFADLMQTYGE